VVTKSEALDRFINERVLGDRGFGYNPETELCEYSHQQNGGCEIGQYIPQDYLERSYILRDNPSAGQIPEVLAYHGFEDPTSRFWTTLQGAHDSLALFSTRPTKDRWKNFEASMKDLSEDVK
jgi:hypothetical protein